MKTARALGLFLLAAAGCTTTTNYNVSLDLAGLIPAASTDMAVAPECTPGDKQCVDDTTTRVCAKDGTWAGIACGDGEICMDGDCQFDLAGAQCTPGDGACIDDKTAARCKASGMGYNMVTCPTGTSCIGTGMCAGTCVIGATSCDPDTGALLTCTDGATLAPTACPMGTLCVPFFGASDAPAACISTSVCSPGANGNGCDSVCGNKLSAGADQTKFVSTCVPTPTGFQWQVSGCLSPAVCSPTAGSCAGGQSSQAACAATCTNGEQVCSSNGIQTCGADGTFGAPVACDLGGDLQCIPDPNNAGKALCADLLCANGAAGTCVLSSGVSKLRPCVNGRLAAADQLVACNPGLCAKTENTTYDGLLPGKCIQQCKAGDTVCGADFGILGCDATSGTWSTVTTTCFPDGGTPSSCFDSLDTNGRPHALCGDCAPGVHRCVNGADQPDLGVPSGLPKIETCGPDGKWGASVACTVGFCAANGGDAGCTAQCLPGSPVCTGTNKAPLGLSGFVGKTHSATCTSSGLIPASTAPGVVVCSDIALSATCRTDSGGAVLGCVECVGASVGGRNENGLTDTRCLTGNVYTCKSDSTGYVKSQDCGTVGCSPPTAQLAVLPTRAGVYCHACAEFTGSDQLSCTEANLGASCSAAAFSAAVSCPRLDPTAGTAPDCCADHCIADPLPSPALCGPS